ncbi:unnamed protein product [Meloidogyne enterolobii]|uniref:Uncharacterized protein n=1 Tax=Meloidogyne enterolobii TaxID=390850 RepID=A0ACB1ANI2_MELEN
MAAEQETKIVLPVFRKPPNPSFNINGTIENSTIFDWHLQHYNFDEEKIEGDK